MLHLVKVTKQGYYYVEVSKKDCINWGGLGVCDMCGQPFDKGYLTFVLSNCTCSTCFNEWVERAQIYEDDLKLQEEKSEDWFNYHLGIAVMPSGYNLKKIEELNKLNEKLQEGMDEINASIEKGLEAIEEDKSA